MTHAGTVVNGLIRLDAQPQLPEGARVFVELADDAAEDVGFPPEPYDREQELAILRESLEDVKAGRGRPAREVLKEIALRHNLPLEPGE